MATAPTSQLPPLYNDLVVLSREEHANYKIRQSTKAPFMSHFHAVPLTVEEFPLVQRFMPIVFTQGKDAVPLGLMGLNEGVNVFFDEEGTLLVENMYIPAYIRRYPYMLVPLQQNSSELSLCFDPSSDSIGAFEDGQPLFENGEPTELTQNILAFNEQFEQSAHNTGSFISELNDLGLLRDEEMSIDLPGIPQPFTYRGFQIIDEDKLKELRGDQLRKMAQNGMLPLIYCHLYSMTLMRELFDRQLRQNKVPGVTFTPNPDEGAAPAAVGAEQA